MYPGPPLLPWEKGGGQRRQGRANSALSRKHAFCPSVIPGTQDTGQRDLYTCQYHSHTDITAFSGHCLLTAVEVTVVCQHFLVCLWLGKLLSKGSDSSWFGSWYLLPCCWLLKMPLKHLTVQCDHQQRPYIDISISLSYVAKWLHSDINSHSYSIILPGMVAKQVNN